MGISKETKEFRKKAEAILKSNSVIKQFPDSEADSLKLIHELQVHEIELELINEELNKARELAEVTAEKYSELYYAPLGYFTLTDKGEIIDVNPNGSKMLGESGMQLINRRFAFYISNEFKPVFDHFLERIFITNTIQTCEIDLNLNESIPVSAYLNGLVKGNNKQCQVVAIDISVRKSAEKEKELLLAKLSNSQAKLNIALQSGNIGVWEWNIERDEIIWDERTEKMFGLIPGTFGKTMQAFEDLINEEDISHVRTAFKLALEKNLPFETVVRSRLEINKPRYISAKATIVNNENGKPLSMEGVFFDVTGLKEGTEQIIEKLNKELLRSNKELENFAYVASHDLQEPLRMVSSFTQMLQKQYGDKLDDRALEYMSFAVDGARRMYDLLNGLLQYSRIRSKGKEFSLVDMNEVLESVLKNLNLVLSERKAKIKTVKLPVIFADKSQMIQIFQNLISNAIKFSHDSPKISITCANEDHNFIFSIRDFGMGIEAQYFDKIFQMFQRLLPNEHSEGTGIGLAICRRIIERHKGKIWVESELGKGSAFFFTIPKSEH